MTVNRRQLVISNPKPARAAQFWCHALHYAPQPTHHATATDHEHPWARLRNPDGHPFRII